MRNSFPIFFVMGFMGTGKTTISKKAAGLLNIPCYDLDACIVDGEHQSINQIFEEKGEDYFRTLEQDYLNHLLDQVQEPTIIALGGGTPCYEKNMQWLKKHGKTVYLASSVDRLTKILLNNKDKRPLLKDVDDVPALIESMLKEREPYYNNAHHTIVTDGKSFDQVAEELKVLLEHTL